MQFDPAVAAQDALTRSVASGELGEMASHIEEAEDTFSSSAGASAKEAYLTLQAIGAGLPKATAFQEFLIYITWQQVVEETIPSHFQKGVALCNGYLSQDESVQKNPVQISQIQELRKSFRAGLGLEEDDLDDYDDDVLHGGD